MPLQFLTLGLALVAHGQEAPLFTDSDRATVVSYWKQPGRYAKETHLPWVVRLTPEGSLWLWRYNRARGLAKTNPLSDPGALSPDQADWEKWIDAKVAYDRSRAAIQVATSNPKELDDSESEKPAEPGPMPQALHDLVGEAPAFAGAYQPTKYSVAFDDGTACTYTDAVNVRPRYAYFRWTQGVTTSGAGLQGISQEEVARLCRLAGLSGTEKKVMAAVSPLEGGFDSVNTYDTGFVSVGFIQFACLQGGAGSLGAVLSHEKSVQPDAFAADFRRFGIDVWQTGKLDCVNPETGEELTGSDAAKAIIDDKRLTAVFQRAGQRSDAFRIAQLQTARDMYYPSNDTVPIATELGTVSCHVGDFIHSEAGLAILMDRKVNTGNLGALASVVADVMQDTGAQTVDDLASHEMEIVQALIFRKDFLSDPTLSQPAGDRRTANLNSRHGNRKPKGSSR